MNNFIPSSILIAAVFFSALLTTAVAQDTTKSNDSPRSASQLETQKELDQAAQAYRKGLFVEAQAHSERALQLDPENKTAPFFIARTIHAQYKPGVSSEANYAKAREAISAYQSILVRNPNNDEAYKAVAYLYGSIHEDELLRTWVLARANSLSATPEQRAEAYVVLASKYWDCSFQITELPNHKQTIVDPEKNQAVVHWVKPKDEEDLRKAESCVAEGLKMVDAALALSPDNESGWSYKTNLILESSKLAEMKGDTAAKSALETEYQQAQKRTIQLGQKREAGKP